MYSDSDVEAYEEYNSTGSTEGESAAELTEQQIARIDDSLSMRHTAYEWIFNSEDGFFKTHFANMIPGASGGTDRWDSPQSPDCLHAVAALLHAAAGDMPAALPKGSVGTGASSQRAQNGSLTDADAAAAVAAAVTPPPAPGAYTALPTDGKPSPASRFLCANFGACVLIPVDTALNRAQLRAAHADLGVEGVEEGGLDVVPGYRHTEAAGWALPISVDAAVLAALKARHPGWRHPTPADVSLFTKPDRSNCNGGGAPAATSASPQLPSRRTWTLRAAQLMRSKERFLSCVTAAGGWSKAIFVAVDVEAFTVAAHSVPLPAEYAFEPIYWSALRRAEHSNTKNTTEAEAQPAQEEEGKEKHQDAVAQGAAAEASNTTATAAALTSAARAKQLKPLHFFCHPGAIPLEEEVTILHNCLATHLIPFRNAAFLTHDYRTKLRQVDTCFLRNPRVIFISKGSPMSPTLMDLQAIRWLYGAALWQQHHFCDVTRLTEGKVGTLPLPIPDAEDIRCFDVSVLEAAAAEASSLSRAAQPNGETKAQAKNGRKTKEPKGPRCCAYHAVVEECGVTQDEVHCAQRDAQVLVERIRTALEREQPSQSPR